MNAARHCRRSFFHLGFLSCSLALAAGGAVNSSFRTCVTLPARPVRGWVGKLRTGGDGFAEVATDVGMVMLTGAVGIVGNGSYHGYAFCS